MKRAFCIVAGVLIIAISVDVVRQDRECSARGGVLVKGAFEYVCVAAARAAP